MTRVVLIGGDAALAADLARRCASSASFELVPSDARDSADVAVVAGDGAASAHDHCRAVAGVLPCVIVSDEPESTGVLLAAMEAGARGVVGRALDAFELDRALGAAAALGTRSAAPTRALGTTIAVSAGAGGAGTSTVAWALAAIAPGPVAVLDLDLAGGVLARLAGVADEIDSAGLAGETSGSQAFARLAVEISIGRLVPAPPRLELAWLPRNGLGSELLRCAAEWARTVVVDAGRGIGPALEAIVDADLNVVVARPGVAAAAIRSRHARVLEDLAVEPSRILFCTNARRPWESTEGAAAPAGRPSVALPYDRRLGAGVVSPRIRRMLAGLVEGRDAA